MRVKIDLPDQALRDLDELAKKKITRTQALLESIETTKEIARRAPHGARIVPVSRVGARLEQARRLRKGTHEH
jgi:hypothetical protein